MLDRAVWTEADFDVMGWHDATVYGVAFPPAEPHAQELLLDIDYIVRWVEPEPPEQAFRFWVAPATLVFHEVYDLRGRLEVEGDLEIADLHRHRDVAEAGRDRGPVSFDRPTTFGDSPEPRGP